MIENRAFTTRARTLDHLGREQIADVPTAISELWKNSYDAYATIVKLTAIAGNPLVVSLFDDGYGMSKADLIDKWLVVGTESKLAVNAEDSKPFFGLKYRPKQGQKGIGRLSAGHLGSLLLLISKTAESENYAALLIDWRIFENPYLFLSDITIPVLEVGSLDDVFSALPELFDALIGNVIGDVGKPPSDAQKARDLRIKEAWRLFDEGTMNGEFGDVPDNPPSKQIVETTKTATFQMSALDEWPVATGTSKHGTALIIVEANEEIENLFVDGDDDDSKNRFIQTLAGFVDPFMDLDLPTELNAEHPELQYEVEVQMGEKRKVLLSSDEDISRVLTSSMEHVVEGSFDANGVFRGKVKAFGKWMGAGHHYIVEPPKDYKAPRGPKSELGLFDLYLSTFEQSPANSTHTPEELTHFARLGRYTGLRVYRNGLRVMPYGREDNDFFEIEKRRSMHAGREFWNARRMYGRIAISRKNNPNLKDKAGREGFIINAAARNLKVLVSNVLRSVAREYFGNASELRQSELPEIKQRNAEQKAKAEAEKLRKRQRTQFRSALRNMNSELPQKVVAARSRMDHIVVQSPEDISTAQELLEDVRQLLTTSRVPGAPRNLGSLENEYAQYRKNIYELRDLVEQFTESLSSKIDEIEPPEPWEFVEKQLQRHAGQIHSRVSKWSREIKSLQGNEISRVQELVSNRNKLLHQMGQPIIEKAKAGQLTLSEASKALTSLWQTIDTENEDIFENYVFALESLRDSIDLQTVAVMGEQENAELRAELDRLNSLAQLGIAVEILGHELQSYDDMIGRGLAALPEDFRYGKATGQLIQTGYEGLTQQLRFLAPLQLSGKRTQRKITGEEIHEYLSKFFAGILEREDIHLSASKSFRNFSVFGQPARLLPVFVNLVNNSIYWLSHSQIEKKNVLLEVSREKVVVADNGPGVDELDVKRLFTLFFTKKTSGGRGIGLYLCKANLAAGFHEIEYEAEGAAKILPGANFSIKFKNAEFSDG